jgi:hypothetical protein
MASQLISGPVTTRLIADLSSYWEFLLGFVINETAYVDDSASLTLSAVEWMKLLGF